MRYRILSPVLGALLVLVAIPSETLGQTVRDPILKGNPYRDIGGSCVYDKNGKVVFAPEGKDCPDRSNHLSKRGPVASPLLADYPPALREELAKLLSDHEHLAGEVARLRGAVDAQNRAVALEAVEKIRVELADHRAREEQFLEKLAPSRAAR